MILLLHIAIALSSVALSTYTFFRPSRTVLHVSYGLVGATFASGFYMIAMTPTHLVQACISGLVYLGVIAFALLAARQKITLIEKSVR